MSDVSSGFVRTDDGVDLYWRVVGEQGPVLACCNGIGVSTFFWKYIALHFRDRYRVVLWDYRGHGLSQTLPSPERTDLSIARNAKDLLCVLDAVGASEPAVLLGHSMGCQVILEAHALRPERVRALVLLFGTYGRALETFFDSSVSRRLFRHLHSITGPWGRAQFRYLLPLYASPLAFAFSRATGVVDRYDAARVDMNHYMEHLQHMDPKVFLAMLDQLDAHDREAWLPHVDVPSLVFGGENDLFTPLRCSRHMARRIPGAELMVLPEGSHAAIVEHPETINLRLERFLRERVFPAA